MPPRENLSHWLWIPSVGNVLAWNTLVFSAKSPHRELYLKIISRLLPQKLHSRTRERRLFFFFLSMHYIFRCQLGMNTSNVITYFCGREEFRIIPQTVHWLANEWRFSRPIYLISELTSSRSLNLLRNFIYTTMLFLNKMCSLKLGHSKLL